MGGSAQLDCLFQCPRVEEEEQLRALWAPTMVAVDPSHEAVLAEDVLAWRLDWTRRLIVADDAFVVEEGEERTELRSQKLCARWEPVRVCHDGFDHVGAEEVFVEEELL